MRNPGHWDNRSIFALLWPLIIEQLLAVTMGAADTAMVSAVGEFAVTGVNIVDNINNLAIIAFVALCTGGTVVVSQYIGRGEAANANLAARQLVYIAAAVSFVIGALIALFRRPVIAVLYGAVSPDVMEASSVYFLITAASYPFLALYNANAALFRAQGNSAVTMRVALCANLINVAGNALLIYGAGLGVAGAAISTLTSRVVSAVVTLVLMTRSGAAGESAVNLRGITRFVFMPRMVRNIMNVGIPTGIENSMFQIGRLATQRIFTVFGTAAMAGNAIAGVVNSFSFMPGMAFSMTLLTIVGQCVGAGNYDEAKKHTRKIITWSYMCLVFTCLIVLLFMEPILGLFQLSNEAHISAKLFLQIHCVSMALAWAPSFAMPNALRAAGDNRYVMIVASVSMWVVRVLGAYILTFVAGFGPVGVWIAMGADFFVRGGFYVTRWVRGAWQTKRVIEE